MTRTISQTLALIFTLTLTPLAALALPAVGDVVGTNAKAATAALAKSGCTVTGFENEDGKVEAKCTDEGGKLVEVVIDPKTGAVVSLKSGD